MLDVELGSAFPSRIVASSMTAGNERTSTTHRLVAMSLVALVYMALAHLSLTVVVVDSLPTVWAPAGFALAALVIGSRGWWPAVLAGALGTFLTQDLGPTEAVVASAAATLQACAGALMLARFSFSTRLDRVRDIVVLVALGGFAPIAAGVSLTTIAFAVSAGPATPASLAAHWISWWMAGTVGVVLVAPIVMGLARMRSASLRRPTAGGAGVVLAVLGSSALSVSAPGLSYIVFPSLLLAAIRFRPAGAASAGMVVAATVAWAGSSGFGPLEAASPVAAILSGQAFILVATLTSLLLGAVTAERIAARERLLDSEAERLILGVEREAEQRFRRSFEDAPIGMAMLGFHGHLLRVNHAMAEITGFAESDLIGRKLDELTHPADVGAEGERLESLLSGAIRTYEVEKRLVRSNGEVAWVLLGGSMVRDDAGRPAYLIAQLIDITERRRVEAELARSTEELQRSNQELERFAYIASHDLAEPLRTMSGFATLLRERYDEVLDERGLRYADHVVGAARRMRELIDGLLEYSRAGRQELSPEPVDLRALATEIVAELDARVQERGALVSVGELPTVSGDPMLLRQLLQNLIANALKFTAARAPVVSIAGEWTPVACRISVSDNGIGIEPRHAERIFEMFQRLHTSEDFEGTGIGLALTKRIVELHGGSISVQSRPGQGATFSFTLPVVPSCPRLTTALAA